MGHSGNKVEWCLKKASTEGEKHRGLKIISPDYNIAQAHLSKAGHNLNVMDYLIKGGFSDWVVNASFYAHYHCLVAILIPNDIYFYTIPLGISERHNTIQCIITYVFHYSLLGYESRNQECTFAAVMNLIEEGKLNLKEQDISYISSNAGDMDEPSIVELRERFQYGTETSYARTRMHELFFETMKFIERAKVIVEEIKEKRVGCV
ncbi:MAG: hypothetical protein QME12_02680 [Nanoarchaeota archaeon]|nr:hypothetical protein [Nanoarchaeota archaeon]